MTATNPCSNCDGTGRVFLAAHPVPDLPCLVCKGDGSVPDLMAALQQSVTAAKAARKNGSRPLAERHQQHYQTCNCLGDSAECCVADCDCHENGSEDTPS